MTRFNTVSPEEATGRTKELFAAIESKLGVVPNMMRTMANSTALLEGYLNLSGALATGSINAKTGELIAITVAENNHCDYCLSAHHFIGANLLKIDDTALSAARKARSTDPKTETILQFAKTLITKNGMVSDADVDIVKQAGVTEAQIGEIVGHVALNILTNYFNNTAKTEIDFPVYQVAAV
ncbi:carboxymuconolactone decarboxylase family protein [Flavobacterium sp.]|uniref:carboxymuconolactone decarboxylase family protein n=1 Tax=Flavobacterium sp. TaxID=239 RepID=UPI003D6B0846